ncbi:hypothetical protein FRB98_008740 [Tulasnella sp. 332]|nr:hypothetical protein FRB98_008740 [Tulasnella sp. 332]
MPLNYRLVFLSDIARIIFLPSFVVTVLLAGLSRFNVSDGASGFSYPQLCVIYALSVPSYWICDTLGKRWKAQFEAWRLNVGLIRSIHGKKIGNTDVLQRMAVSMQKEYAGGAIDELLDEAGSDTIQISILGNNKIFTRDPTLYRYVMADGFQNFGKGAGLAIRAATMYGSGVIWVDGPLWKFHRTLTTPYFTRGRLNDLQIFEKHSMALISRMKSLAEADQAMDVQDLIGRAFMDLSCEYVLGVPLDSINGLLPVAGESVLGFRGSRNPNATKSDSSGLTEAFEAGLINMGRRRAQGDFVWRALELFKDSQETPAKISDAWLDPIVDRAFEAKAKGEGMEKDGSETLLQHTVATVEDRKLAKDTVLTVVLSARDTTTSLMTFMLYLLSKHPDVLARLRSEVLDTVGPDAMPSHAQLGSMSYVRAVLNETLRLFPSLPIQEREALHSCVVPTREGSQYIPKGTTVILSTISIHRSQRLWGEDADVFEPQRWIDGGVKESDTSRFMPFLMGPRVCIGKDMALLQATFMMTRLMQHFSNFTLRQAESAPDGALPPASWKSASGRKREEEIWPRSALSMFSKSQSEPARNFDPRLIDMQRSLTVILTLFTVVALFFKDDIMLCLTRTLATRRFAHGAINLTAASMSSKAAGFYTLPELPYAYDLRIMTLQALEPHICKEIMELHHKKHHQAYVNGLNDAEKKYSQASLEEQLTLQAALKFNGGGHINHSLFWKNLAPSSENGGKLVEGNLKDAITRDFGSVDKFKESFNAKTAAIQGSGWGWLGFNPTTKKLEIVTTANQDPLLSHAPIIGIDIWEHAFYLQYRNVKPDYLKAIWNVVNFEEAEKRFADAVKAS